MELTKFVRSEIQHRIPKALLDFINNFEATLAGYLQEAIAPFGEHVPAKFWRHIQQYVEHRIQQAIFEQYEKLDVKPETYKGYWHELIMEYRDGGALAEDAFMTLETLTLVYRRTHNVRLL